ncbi:hypothetical protein ACFQ88_11250 [Paenibacillus sp. NPDC056579]
MDQQKMGVNRREGVSGAWRIQLLEPLHCSFFQLSILDKKG